MSTIDLVDDSSSESGETALPPSPPPTRPSRPKLRTRRAIAYQEEEDEGDANAHDSDDVEMRIAMPTRAASTPAPAPRGRATRTRNEAKEAADASYEEDEDDEEEDDDMDDFVDDDEEEEDEEEIVGRRRSSRTRKSVRRQEAEEEDDDDDDEAEFKMQVQRAKRQSAATARRASRQASTQSSQAAPSRKRKRPQNGSKAKAKSKPKSSGGVRGPRGSDDDEYVKPNSEDSENDEWLVSEVESADNGAESDEMDENAFIVEKILAREVHTLKGWKRLRENRTTRFLQNGSIFIDDDEEEEEGADQKKKKQTEDESDDVVVVVDGPTQQQQEREEERFLIKWKNLSYIHVSWELEKNLLEVDRMVKGKIQRFREKEQLGLLADRMHNGDEYFNPEFRDVDRILDIQDKPGDKYTPVDDEEEDDDDEEEDGEGAGEKKTKKKLKYMLVKWKAQPYDALTWEREDDVHDDAAVQEYEKRLERAAMRYKRMSTTKPSRSNSRKMPKFRGYSATNRPPFKEGLENMELRDYQLTGVNWMLLNWYQRRNSMLADEMGLGKTLQTVTYVNHLAVAEELPGPYLIVAPLSTLGHWQREFANWTNLNAVVYHGSADARKMIQEFEFFLSADEYKRVMQNDASGKGGKLPKPQGGTCYRFDVLITTFEMCSAPDFAKLARVKWQLLVVDEAHRLKNRNSKLTTTIKKNFEYQNILLLTGTPLQNNVEELWTLLHMLDEERFDSMEDFMLDYGELKDMSQVEKLHAELKPFLLRRMKEDVEKSLAPKEETIIEVELTVLQKQYYRAIYEQNTEFLARGMKRSHAPSLMNVLMELRKCCNHPFLIRGMEQREIARLREQKDIAREELERQAVELLVTASGKLILLDKLLPRLQENGHRVLIFSQFKIMLDILQDYLRLRAYRCERIDGNITGNDRQAAIDRFCDPNSQAFIMLLSTRAGGVGINLTAADTVIIYDSDWNPQNDLQAQARCHRIGQKKSVKIYRLLTAKTYELHMFHQASLKLGLDQAVLGSIRDQQNSVEAVGKTKRPNAQMSKDEIENLLKHGAYEMFKEDKDGEAEAASKRFSEESIDQILSRSTKIIHDPKAQEDGAGNGKKSLMSSFSKATFVSSDDPDAQVALDDPDFWTKVVGLQQPEKVEPSPLKRRRCRVKSYLQEDSADENEKATKKRGPGRPKKTDRDEHEEFVISSSEDDDDDDDESDSVGTDEQDDFEPGNKKNKKQKKGPGAKANNLPIYVYQERISELLTTYGYGRWDEMVSYCPILTKYSREELVTFTREYIVSLVRVAATSHLLVKQNPPAPVFEPGQPPPPPAPRPLVTKDQLADWLDAFANKFRIVETLLTDLSVSRFSRIPITSPALARRASNAKAEREAASKLQQIDRMQQLLAFVRAQIGPIAPMVELLRRFPKDKPWNEVQDTIMKCDVPPPLPVEDEKAADVVDVEAPEERSPPEAPATSASEGVAEEVQGDAKAKAQEATTEAPTEDKAGTEPASEAKGGEVDAGAKGETLVEGEKPGGWLTRVVSRIFGSGTAEEAEKPMADTEKATEDGEKPTGDAEKPAEDAKESETKPPSEATDAPASVPPEESTSPSDAETKKAKEEDANVPVVDTPKTATAAEPTISDEQLRSTMLRLQALPEIGSALSVAPWWVSVIDDVLLLLFIYKNGWIKGRSIPTSLAKDDLLFGSRAAPYEAVMWPSVIMLNKRARMLLATWTNSRRLAAQANAVLLRRRKSSSTPATAPMLGGRVLVPPTLPASMAHTPQLHSSQLHATQLHPTQHHTAQHHSVHYQVVPHHTEHHSSHFHPAQANHTQLHAAQLDPAQHHPAQTNPAQHYPTQSNPAQANPSSYVSEPTQDVAKRGRFAKLVYMFGVPDTRMCTTDHSRKQKWRYFRDDAQLNISGYPLEELQAEAEDLVRFCRVRASYRGDPTQAPLPPMPEPRMRSILGSRRGDWGIINGAKCRRLLQRIELFKSLRNELLCLPSKTLVMILNHVLDEMNEADPTLRGQYPPWWHAPRHDMYLLQGVECHGLDEKLPFVWGLKQFVEGKESGVYPSATWVENHVQTITNRARLRIAKHKEILRKQQERQAERQRQQFSHHQQQQATQQQQLQQHLENQRLRIEMQLRQREQAMQLQQQREAMKQRQQEQVRRRLQETQPAVSEARQRIRDIQGMRSEDSQYSQNVRLRMIEETRESMEKARTAEAAKAEAQASSDVEMAEADAVATEETKAVEQVEEVEEADLQASALDMFNSLKEVRLMKSEDPYYSIRVGTIWLEQRKHDLAQAEAKKTSEAEAAASSRDATPAEKETEVKVTAEDAVDDEEEVEVEEVKGEVSQSTPPALANGSEPATPKTASTENISPLKTPQPSSAAISVSDQDEDAEVDSTMATPVKAPAPAPPASASAATDDSPNGSVSSSGQKRKRVPRAWEVIVIDDSDDDEEESAPVVKRTTRSRRRRRGDSLADGL